LNSPRRITATVVKESSEQKLGISLKRNPADGSTVIGRVNPDGLFGKSKLKEGMHVVSVNNVDAKESSLQDLLAVMTTATGPITILAKDAGSEPAVAPKRSSFSNLFGSGAAAPAAEAGKQYVAKCRLFAVDRIVASDRINVVLNRYPFYLYSRRIVQHHGGRQQDLARRQAGGQHQEAAYVGSYRGGEGVPGRAVRQDRAQGGDESPQGQQPRREHDGAQRPPHGPQGELGDDHHLGRGDAAVAGIPVGVGFVHRLHVGAEGRPSQAVRTRGGVGGHERLVLPPATPLNTFALFFLFAALPPSSPRPTPTTSSASACAAPPRRG
jgi:PDZ domain